MVTNGVVTIVLLHYIKINIVVVQVYVSMLIILHYF